MTRADCQAVSKHYHVCWLSIPCSQHKIGGQRIIGVRDGKDIWGQLVHPTTVSYPLSQIIPHVTLSLPALAQFSRSSLSSSHHLWGVMLEALSSFSLVKRDIASALSWHSWTSLLVVATEALNAYWMSLCCLVMGLLLIVCGDTRKKEPLLNYVLYFCFLYLLAWRELDV